MGRCVRASGAQGSSRRQPETPHEVFLVNLKLQASSIKISQNRKIISFHAQEPSITATSPIKTWLSPNVCWSLGGSVELLISRARKKKTGELPSRERW